MNNNPYENNYPEQNTENINSSVNPEDTVHINDSTPDYTPDEYYQKHYADKTVSADNYAKYGENFYSENNSQNSNAYNTQNNNFANSSYQSNPYPNYSSPAGQNNYGVNNSAPVSNYTQSSSSSANYKKKKEKKPVTKGTVAVMLIWDLSYLRPLRALLVRRE